MPVSTSAAESGSELDAAARSLRDALTELTRVLQFRDRDCLCNRDISVTQCHALDALVSRGPMPLNELAGVLYVDKSTASRVVDGLERKGWVRRGRHPVDRRALLLEATAEGEAVCQDIRSDLLQDCKTLLGDFAPEVRESLTHLIDRLARAAAARVTTEGGSCCRVDPR